MELSDFSRILTHLRKEKGVSQKKAAQELGVSKGIISIWENNINEPKATYIQRLALFFGVSADYLLGITD